MMHHVLSAFEVRAELKHHRRKIIRIAVRIKMEPDKTAFTQQIDLAAPDDQVVTPKDLAEKLHHLGLAQNVHHLMRHRRIDVLRSFYIGHESCNVNIIWLTRITDEDMLIRDVWRRTQLVEQVPFGGVKRMFAKSQHNGICTFQLIVKL